MSADGFETISYSYDGSNRLTGVTGIDGSLTTFTSTGSTSVGIASSSGRTTTLTLASGDLTKITNPDGGVRSKSETGGVGFRRGRAGAGHGAGR